MEIFKVGELYHIGVAVQDAEKTAKLYEKTLGLTIAHDETVMDQGVRAIMLLPQKVQQDMYGNVLITTVIQPLHRSHCSLIYQHL